MGLRSPTRSPAGRRPWAFLVAVTVPALLAAAPPASEQERVRWLGEMRHVALYSPPTTGGQAPLLLVLGEPGGGARYALDNWRSLAEREGFIVASVSSRDKRQWRSPHDSPGLLRAVVQKIASRHSVDRRRVYLFGSGTASGFALALATLQPRYFAAVAGFDGNIMRGSLDPSRQLERELPMLIYHSKRYPQFEVDALQATAKTLRGVGARVTVEKLPVVGGFERKGIKTANLVWQALSAHSLDEDPRYTTTLGH